VCVAAAAVNDAPAAEAAAVGAPPSCSDDGAPALVTASVDASVYRQLVTVMLGGDQVRDMLRATVMDATAWMGARSVSVEVHDTPLVTSLVFEGLGAGMTPAFRARVADAIASDVRLPPRALVRVVETGGAAAPAALGRRALAEQDVAADVKVSGFASWDAAADVLARFAQSVQADGSATRSASGVRFSVSEPRIASEFAVVANATMDGVSGYMAGALLAASVSESIDLAMEIRASSVAPSESPRGPAAAPAPLGADAFSLSIVAVVINLAVLACILPASVRRIVGRARRA
jgi:hypothetical protein